MGGGWRVGVVGKAENIATQPSLAGAWAELGNKIFLPKSCWPDKEMLSKFLLDKEFRPNFR